MRMLLWKWLLRECLVGMHPLNLCSDFTIWDDGVLER